MLDTELPHKKLAGSDLFMVAPFMPSHLNFMTSHIGEDEMSIKGVDRFVRLMEIKAPAVAEAKFLFNV